MQKFKQTGRNTTWFMTRREPLYHKLQYSKTPKYDPAAAVFGTVLGAFVVYLALNTVGTGGPDMADLTALVVYVGLWLFNLRWVMLTLRGLGPGLRYPLLPWLSLCLEVAAAVTVELRVIRTPAKLALLLAALLLAIVLVV